ncbi:MAG: hypothetical protein DPW14_04250 [Planctomycetes bacterium]|nr:hypothetical protein [Planctomycetota bacterium]
MEPSGRIAETPSALLRKIVEAKPSFAVTEHTTWRIGNVEEIDNDWLYLRLGKTTSSKNEEYKDGNFVELPSDASPSTPTFVNIPLELVCIAHKQLVAGRVQTSASRFQEMLNAAALAKKSNADFQVRVIRDPQDFIKALRAAVNIKKFAFDVSPPNAIDESAFAKAASEYVKKANGKSGKVEVKGDSLDPDALEPQARTAISLGNEASAAVSKKAGQPPQPIYSKRDNLAEHSVAAKELADPERRSAIAAALLALYQKIRGDG